MLPCYLLSAVLGPYGAGSGRLVRREFLNGARRQPSLVILFVEIQGNRHFCPEVLLDVMAC